MFHLRLKMNTTNCICGLQGNFISRVRGAPCMDYETARLPWFSATQGQPGRSTLWTLLFFCSKKSLRHKTWTWVSEPSSLQRHSSILENKKQTHRNRIKQHA